MLTFLKVFNVQAVIEENKVLKEKVEMLEKKIEQLRNFGSQVETDCCELTSTLMYIDTLVEIIRKEILRTMEVKTD